MYYIDIIFLVFGSNLLQLFKEFMVKDKRKERKLLFSKENEFSDSEEEVFRFWKLWKCVDLDLDLDLEDDINLVMKCLLENLVFLIEFVNVFQGILLFLMLK